MKEGEDVKRIRENQDKIAVALEAMDEGPQDNDASALKGTLQALLEAQAAALTLLQSLILAALAMKAVA